MSQSLNQQFDQQRQLAEQLLIILQQESAAVLGSNIELLQNINQNKLNSIQALKAMEAHWPAPLRSDQASQWIARQKPVVQESWQQLVKILKECRRQNDANGLLIAQRQQVVSARLQGGGGQTYGAGGQQITEGGGRWSKTA